MGDRSQTRGTRVYVGGLTNEVTKEEIETEFERYGKLNSVWVALNPPGFAFVEFAEKEDAEAACDNLNNTELLGSTLRVELSRARRRGGGRGGGFGGRGGFGGGRGGGFRRGGGGGGRDGGYPRSRSPFRRYHKYPT